MAEGEYLVVHASSWFVFALKSWEDREFFLLVKTLIFTLSVTGQFLRIYLSDCIIIVVIKSL